jgi:hypothetical protein
MSKDVDQRDSGYIFCRQCGIIISYEVWYKRKIRNRDNWDHCRDCIATPRKIEVTFHPSLGRIECVPYVGEVNELWQPINAVGDLYLPGERICGHKDCVNKNHIRQPEPKTVSDLDLLLGMIEIDDFHKKASA